MTERTISKLEGNYNPPIPEDSKFPMPHEDSPCGVYVTENNIAYLFERTADNRLIAVWRNFITFLEMKSQTGFNIFESVTREIDWHIVFSKQVEQFIATVYNRADLFGRNEISPEACAIINVVFKALSDRNKAKLLPRE